MEAPVLESQHPAVLLVIRHNHFMLNASDLVGLTGQLLEVVTTGTERSVNDLVFADEWHSSSSGDVLLGAGISTEESAGALLRSASEIHAAAVILRGPWAWAPEITNLARERSITLLALEPAISWTHLIMLLRDSIDRNATGSPGPHASLFAVADAAAQILDAPVTIEDARSRVLAYSLHHERTDAARVSTIIGRRVPERIVSHFRSRGVFRKMMHSDDPIYVPEGPDGTLPRLIVPIRAAGEWLGSIWALVAGPATAGQIRELSDATRGLAMHLLRLRTEANLDQRLSAEQVRVALTESSASLPADTVPTPCRVVAFSSLLPGDRDPARDVSMWTSILQRNGWLQPIITDLAAAVFVVASEAHVSVREPGSWPWLTQVVQATASANPGLRIGASTLVGATRDLPIARSQAEEVLALNSDQTLSVFEAEWADLAVHRALDGLTSWEEVKGPLTELIEHDTAGGTDLLGTLCAFLDHPGDPASAAAALHVHPNTLRYRMKKISHLTRLKAATPQERLALHLLARAALNR